MSRVNNNVRASLGNHEITRVYMITTSIKPIFASLSFR